MGFKPINSNKKIHFIKCQKRDFPIHVLMGFKPMTKYFPAFEISNKRAYEVMGFRPMTSKSKYFPAYEISKESLENSGFHGI